MRRPKLGSIYQRKKKQRDGSVVMLPTWWIKYHRNGQAFRESSHSEDYSEAEKLLKRRQGEIVTGRFGGLGPERIRMADLFGNVIEDYELHGRATLENAKIQMDKHLMPAFGKVRAAEFTTAHVTRYVAHRRREAAANATINRELAFLKRSFKLGAKSDPPKVIRVPHIQLLPEHNVREGLLDVVGYKRLLSELPDYLKVLFVVAYHTGVRSGELKKIRVAQVDLAGKEIHVSGLTTKAKEGHTLPIYGDMGPWIEMRVAERDAKFPQCPWLFFNEDGKQIGNFRKTWTSACKRAGIPGLLFHDLRRSAVVNMDRAGVPRRVIMQITGHKTEVMFTRYRIVAAADLKQAARRMGAYLGNRSKALGTLLGTPKSQELESCTELDGKLLN
jgi:integrase